VPTPSATIRIPARFPPARGLCQVDTHLAISAQCAVAGENQIPQTGQPVSVSDCAPRAVGQARHLGQSASD